VEDHLGRALFDDKNKKRILEDSNTGWDFRQQVMDIIQKRTGVKYHEVHISIDCCIDGSLSKIPSKRFVRTATQEEKKKFKKG
jgi:hypothetical protein